MIDLIVVLFLVAVLVLVMLMAMPRGREQARLTACQKNLAQIGLALALYDQTQHQLPTIDRPEPIDDSGNEQAGSPGPLKILLETLGQADFLGLAPNASPPHPTGPVPGEIPVPGFICSSDPNATAGLFRAPVSYRGDTGGDHLGRDGVFAPGRRISLAEIERGDGSSYTAAFSERLVGDSVDGHLSPWNYAAAAGPLPAQGCSLIWLKDQVSTGAAMPARPGSLPATARPSTTTPCNRALPYPAWPWTDTRPSWEPRAATAGELTCSCSTARSSSSYPRSTAKVWRDFAAVADPPPRPQDP